MANFVFLNIKKYFWFKSSCPLCSYFSRKKFSSVFYWRKFAPAKKSFFKVVKIWELWSMLSVELISTNGTGLLPALLWTLKFCCQQQSFTIPLLFVFFLNLMPHLIHTVEYHIPCHNFKIQLGRYHIVSL